jgi:hypothetical protein
MPVRQLKDCGAWHRRRIPQFLRYTTIALRQRLLGRLNEGLRLGMALEGLTAADLAYQG